MRIHIVNPPGRARLVLVLHLLLLASHWLPNSVVALPRPPTARQAIEEMVECSIMLEKKYPSANIDSSAIPKCLQVDHSLNLELMSECLLRECPRLGATIGATKLKCTLQKSIDNAVKLLESKDLIRCMNKHPQEVIKHCRHLLIEQQMLLISDCFE